jgi:hypothetical protein
MCRKLLFLIALLGLAGFAKAADLLSNIGLDGTFESYAPASDYNDTTMPGWNFEGTAGNNAWAKIFNGESGTKAIQMGMWTGLPFPARLTTEAEFSAIPGVTYTIGGNIGASSWPGNGTAVLSLRFYDSSDTLLVESSKEFILPGYVSKPIPLLTYDFGAVAPANTASVRPVWATKDNFVGNVEVDNVTLVPEPATIALLSLGSLFLIRRRKPLRKAG